MGKTKREAVAGRTLTRDELMLSTLLAPPLSTNKQKQNQCFKTLYQTLPRNAKNRKAETMEPNGYHSFFVY